MSLSLVSHTAHEGGGGAGRAPSRAACINCTFPCAVRGVVDLVWLPWQQYQEDGRMFRGLQRGASSFTSSTGSASLELASRMVAAVEVWAWAQCLMFSA